MYISTLFRVKEVDPICQRKYNTRFYISPLCSLETQKFEILRIYLSHVLYLQEVIRILQESRADVQVDPILHKACALDIKHYCSNIPQGEGRRKFEISFTFTAYVRAIRRHENEVD